MENLTSFWARNKEDYPTLKAKVYNTKSSHWVDLSIKSESGGITVTIFCADAAETEKVLDEFRKALTDVKHLD